MKAELVQMMPSPLALTPMDMVARAVESGASMEIVERLMAAQERWEANQARKAFDEAMAAAKAEIPTITKNRHVGFDSRKPGASRTDYRHEDMAEIARTIDPILGRHGLSYRFRTSSEPNEPITVTCIVAHRLGHSEENTLRAGRDESGNKNAIQAIGSTITYLQRYTLKAAFGLAAAHDDDGAAGSAGGALTEQQAKTIQQLIVESGANIDVFLKWADAESVADMSASKYAEAMKFLERKKAAKAAGAQK
jgi:hypothetical protein